MMVVLDTATRRRLVKTGRWAHNGKRSMYRAKGIGISRIRLIGILKQAYARLQRTPIIGRLMTKSVSRLRDARAGIR